MPENKERVGPVCDKVSGRNIDRGQHISAINRELEAKLSAPHSNLIASTSSYHRKITLLLVTQPNQSDKHPYLPRRFIAFKASYPFERGAPTKAQAYFAHTLQLASPACFQADLLASPTSQGPNGQNHQNQGHLPRFSGFPADRVSQKEQNSMGGASPGDLHLRDHA
jgi:hypothetical protein